LSASKRATTSGAAPAWAGTINLMGLAGQAWAVAKLGTMANAAAARSTLLRIEKAVMVVS
jgi:hypothetical protein